MTKNDILIKVLSLGIGLAVGIVLIAKVFFELSYDSFYKDIDQVYTINTWYSHQGEEKDFGQVSGAVAVGFMEEVPGVEVGTRTTFVFNGDTYLDEDGNKLKATLVCADTCFFKVFDRPILVGDPVKVLSKWGSVMVSRSFAEKLGGVQEAIGKHDLACFLAARFAVKEAVYKAVAPLTKKGFDFRNVESLHHPDGSPYVSITEQLKLCLDEAGVTALHLSVTTEGDFAQAVVIAEDSTA